MKQQKKTTYKTCKSQLLSAIELYMHYYPRTFSAYWNYSCVICDEYADRSVKFPGHEVIKDSPSEKFTPSYLRTKGLYRPIRAVLNKYSIEETKAK